MKKKRIRPAMSVGEILAALADKPAVLEQWLLDGELAVLRQQGAKRRRS